MDSSAAQADAMRAGLGIGLCPELFLEEEGSELRPVLPDWRFSDFTLYALTPAGRHRVRRVRVFLSWLRDFARDLG